MTQYVVTFSEAALRHLANDPALTPGRVRACPAGLNRLAGRLEFLVHRAQADQPRPTGEAPRVLVLREPDPELLGRRLDDAPFYAPPGVVAAVVVLGVGDAAGRLAGVVRTGNTLRTLDQVRVAGGGLATVALGRAGEEQLPADAALGSWPEEEVWSRTIGALGKGVWRRLRRLHFAVIGCGRAGSMFALGLRKLGVRLTLLDFDILEQTDLGENSAVGPNHVGLPKAEALALALAGGPATISDSPRGLTAVADSVLSPAGLVALKPADVLVCCAADAGARLATGLLAALYMKPLLDLGTGVLRGPGPHGRRLGADVRLVIPGGGSPGTPGCLMCLGGIVDLPAARQALREGPPVQLADDWMSTRLGSLHSLTGVGWGLGQRLLEDLVAGRRTESTWLRIETDATGLSTLEHRAPLVNRRCSACALTGAGDAGMSGLQRVLEEE